MNPLQYIFDHLITDWTNLKILLGNISDENLMQILVEIISNFYE
jgi:hypothetical protein